jgi:uncharacterized protein (TIGR02145 family)
MKHLAYIILCFAMLFNVHLVNAQGDVKIGTQIWTSKNLDVSTFRNGEAIPEVKSKEEWAKAYKNKTAAFWYYDYDSKNGKVYGKLYNWYAVNDPRGLAPKGYHIPSDAEWYILTDFLGGRDIAGKKMKSKDGWSNGGNGDNSSGFNGLPGGYCSRNGYFYDITEYGDFWSSSESYTKNFAWNRYLFNNSTKVNRNDYYKYYGLSVRCLRD